jgi:hypothetical protein
VLQPSQGHSASYRTEHSRQDAFVSNGLLACVRGCARRVRIGVASAKSRPFGVLSDPCSQCALVCPDTPAGAVGCQRQPKTDQLSAPHRGQYSVAVDRCRLLSILSAVKEKSEVRNQPTFAQNRFYLCCDHTAGFRMNLSDGLRPARAACCTPTDLTKSLSSSSRSGPSMSSTRETRSSIWASLRLYSDR